MGIVTSKQKLKIVSPEIDISKWVKHLPSRGKKNTLQGITASISFRNKTKKSSHADSVDLILSCSLLKELGWKNSDRICIYSNPDNILEMALVKRDTGYKLNVLPAHYGRLQFTWRSSVPLKVIPQRIVPFTIHKLGYLIIHAERIYE